MKTLALALMGVWGGTFPLSGKKMFPEFLGNLKKGGAESARFVEENEEMVESIVLASELSMEDLMKEITENVDVPDNQLFFFKMAKRQVPSVRDVLAKRYKACKAMAGFEAFRDATPENLYLHLYTALSEPAEGSESETEQGEEVKQGDGDTPSTDALSEPAEGSESETEQGEEVKRKTTRKAKA